MYYRKGRRLHLALRRCFRHHHHQLHCSLGSIFRRRRCSSDELGIIEMTLIVAHEVHVSALLRRIVQELDAAVLHPTKTEVTKFLFNNETVPESGFLIL